MSRKTFVFRDGKLVEKPVWTAPRIEALALDDETMKVLASFTSVREEIQRKIFEAFGAGVPLKMWFDPETMSIKVAPVSWYFERETSPPGDARSSPETTGPGDASD